MDKAKNHRQNYQKHRQIISSRSQQPIYQRRGNYRLDNNGNPIIDSTRTNKLDDRDYFDRDKPRDFSKRRPGIYYLDEYSGNKRELTNRKNQMRPGLNVRDYRNDQRNQFSRRTGNHYQTPKKQTLNQTTHTSWYYRLLTLLEGENNQGKSKTLPKGKIELATTYLFIYLIIFISAYKISPLNLINNLFVTGNEIVPNQLILNSSRLYPLDSYQEVMKQRKSITDTIISENQMVEAVDLIRPSWQSLEINIVEHDFVGYIYDSGSYYPVLSNGEKVDISDNHLQIDLVINNLPELIGFSTSGERFEIAKGLRQVESNILERMDRIYNTSQTNRPNAIEVHMADGNIIKAITSTFSQKVQYYDQLVLQVAEKLGDQRGVINLEVGAYFDSDTSSVNSIKLNNELDN